MFRSSSKRAGGRKLISSATSVSGHPVAPPPVHPPGESEFFAAYLAHAKRADGRRAKDWCLVETAWRGAGGLLREYRVRPLLSDALTEWAHAAWGGLRMAAPDEQDWRAAQFQT